MRKLFSIFGMLALCATLMAQTPSAFKYQAVARNQSGEVMADQPMSVRISILKGAQVEYSEVHSITTNDLGLFSIEVGRGSPVSGTFFDIVWNEDPHFIRVEMDPAGGSSFVFLGISELLSIPYAMHAETVAQNDDADADPDNEIQDLKVVGNFLRITNNANPTQIDLSQFDTDEQQLSYDADNYTLTLEDGGSVNLQTLMEDDDANPSNELQTVTQVGSIVTLSQGGGTFSVEDADANPINELQTLTQNGNTISLSQGGGSVTITEADGDPTNEIQDLEFNSNYLYIEGHPNPTVVNLNHLLDNTDEQQLAYDSVTGNLALTDGGVVNLSSLEDDADADATNELQTITRAGDDIVLSHNGGTVNIEDGDASATNEIQTVSQNGSTVTLSHGGGTFTIDDADASIVNEIQDLMMVGDSLAITNNVSATVINLGAIDNQTLNFDSSTYELTIANGNTVDLTDLMDDDDSNPLNEIQDLYLSNDSLVITSNPWATVIDMSPYMDNTDAQDMSLTGNSLSITNDASPVDLTPFMDNTDAQTISITNDSMFISGGNAVDLASYLDNTDAQDLNLSAHLLSITNDASPVDLTPYMQDMSLIGNTLSITGDASTVDLAPYMDNTDAQDMTLTGNSLSITGDATPVDLTSFLDADNMGDHTATTNIIMNGNYLSNDGGNEGIKILNNGNVNSSGDLYVGESAGSNRDLYISARMYDWDNNSFYVDPNSATSLSTLTVNAGVVVNTGGVTVSAGGITVTGNSTLTGKFDVTSDVTAASFISTVSTGTAPMTIASTTLVSNLNADMIDGFSSTAFLQGNNDLSDLNDVSDARLNLGVEIGTDVQGYDAGLASIAGLGTVADKMIYTTGVDTYAETDLTAFGRMLVASTNASDARTNIGVVIGTDVQGYDAGLASLAGLGTVADKMIYTTGVDTYAETDLTAFGRTFLGSATAAAGATTLGLGTGNAPTFNGLSLTSSLTVTGDVEVGAADAFYIGDPNVAGSWRVKITATELSFEVFDGLIWVQKDSIAP